MATGRKGPSATPPQARPRRRKPERTLGARRRGEASAGQANERVSARTGRSMASTARTDAATSPRPERRPRNAPPDARDLVVGRRRKPPRAVKRRGRQIGNDKDVTGRRERSDRTGKARKTGRR